MSPVNGDINFDIAKLLIRAWPKMINDFILGCENYGKKQKSLWVYFIQWQVVAYQLLRAPDSSSGVSDQQSMGSNPSR